MKRMNRRQFMQTIFTTAAALPVVGTLLRPSIAFAEDKLITVLAEEGDAMASQMISALAYVNVSETEGQNCTNCLFYEPTADGNGKCQLIPVPGGLVADGGWCSSYSAKA